MVEVVVQVADHFDLLLDNLRKHSVFDCEESSHSACPIFYLGFDAHPERDSRYDFQNDAAETPDINNPWVFVLFHLFQHYLIILQFVLEKDVVKDFRGHVLRSCHGELLQICEEEAAAKINKFHSFDEVVSLSQLLSAARSQQNILSFQI